MKSTHHIPKFLRLLILGLFSLPTPALVHAEVTRIILLQTMPVKVVLDHTRWFREEMKAQGFIEGKNLNLEVLDADGDTSKAERLLRNALKQGHTDLVITSATLASQVAKRVLADRSIPQLFMTVADPVGAGLVSKMGGTNDIPLTGRSHSITRRTKIYMVQRILGDHYRYKPIRLGFIHTSYPSSVGDRKLLLLEAKKRERIIFVPFEIPYRSIPEKKTQILKDVRRAITQIKPHIDFWWEPAGPLGELAEYDILLNHSSKPVLFANTIQSVRLGSLLHIGPDDEQEGRDIAHLAIRILNGTLASSIPVETPSKFILALNLTRIQQQGFTVPEDMLKLAGKYLYY